MSASMDKLQADIILEGHTGTYRIVKPLGLAGATAEVFQVERADDEHKFALKIMHPDLPAEMAKRFKEEMVVLQRLRGEEERKRWHHIPRIIESSNLRESKTQRLFERLDRRPFIIMDFAAGTDVDTLLNINKGHLAEADALEIAKQFAEVLVVLHGANFTYTDMKLDNLFWDQEKRHLMVIDWNVVTKHMTEKELAPKATMDRFRAARYLFQMLTGDSIRLRESASGESQVVDPHFRRTEAFKKLSEGTKAFMLKAFHADPAARHGRGGNQLRCTEDFLDNLNRHVRRFDASPEWLIKHAKGTARDLIWQDAFHDLDVLSRRSYNETSVEWNVDFQAAYDRARDELNRMGRRPFASGKGRYNQGRFAEALSEFERALKDDPFDEEARLFAVLARFGMKVKNLEFVKSKKALEETVSAIIAGSYGLAESALNPVLMEYANSAEIRSLQAEIQIRKAVSQGRRLLETDKLDEAEKQFRIAYRQRGEIRYDVEYLEENLGDLKKLYEQIEQLKELLSSGDALYEQNKFRDAANEYRRANFLYPESNLAKGNLQKASNFAKIQDRLDDRKTGEALSAARSCRTLYPKEAKSELLYNQVVQARCAELRDLASRASGNKEYEQERTHLEELLDILPTDENARIRLSKIDEDISKGFREGLARIRNRLKDKPSIEKYEQAIKEVQNLKYDNYDEGKKFIYDARQNIRAIGRLDERQKQCGNQGKIKKRRNLLIDAVAYNWLLPSGDPQELLDEMQKNIFESEIKDIHKQLRRDNFLKALDMCKNLLHNQQDEEARNRLQSLQKDVERALDLRQEIEEAEKKIALLSKKDGENIKRLLQEELQKIGLQKELSKIKIAKTEAGSADDSELQKLQEKAEDFVSDLQKRALLSLQKKEFHKAKSASNKLLELVQYWTGEGSEFAEIGNRLKTWARTCSDLTSWLDVQFRIEEQLDLTFVCDGLHRILPDEQDKMFLQKLKDSGIEAVSEKRKEALETLEQMAERTPAADWLCGYLLEETSRFKIWQAFRNENLSEAASLLQTEKLTQADYLKFNGLLQLLHQCQALFGDHSQLDLQEAERAKEQVDALLHRLEVHRELVNSKLMANIVEKSNALQNVIQERKDSSIKELSKESNNLIRKLIKSHKDHELQLTVQSSIFEKIGQLKHLDALRAANFETQLKSVSEEIYKSTDRAILQNEESRLVFEIQRRIREKNDDENGESYTFESFQNEYAGTHFESVFPDYRKRHGAMEVKLQSLQKFYTQDPHKKLDELLKLRSESGEFKEIANAISETRAEIARQKNMDLFEQAVANYFSNERNLAEIALQLEKVTPDFSSPEVKDKFEKFSQEVRHRLSLDEICKMENKKDIHKWNLDKIDDWTKALKWACENDTFNYSFNLEALIDVKNGLETFFQAYKNRKLPERLILFYSNLRILSEKLHVR